VPSPRWSAVAALSALIFLWSFSARSETGAVEPVPPPVYGDCTKVPRPSGWKDQERWAWDRICAGEIADLSVFDNGSTDASKWESWPATRQIGSDFLRTILLLEPYRSAVPPAGVRIANARFRDPVDLSHASLVRDLWLDNSRFDRDVTFEGSHLPGMLRFKTAQFAGDLRLYESRIEGDLHLQASVVPGELNLTGAWVGGEADLSGVKLTKTLEMYRFRVERDLILDGFTGKGDVDLQSATVGGSLRVAAANIGGDLTLEAMQDNGSLYAQGLQVGRTDSAGKRSGGKVNLHAAQIKGNVELQDAQLEGMSDLTSIVIGRDLRLDGHGKYAGIDLTGASVAGSADMMNASIGGPLTMYQLRVEADLAMNDLDAYGDVSLQSARVGGYVKMNGAQITGDLNMESLQVGGSVYAQHLNLRERHDDAEWILGGHLNLHAARIMGNLEFTGAEVVDQLDMSDIEVGRTLLLDGDGRYDGIYLTGAHIGGWIMVQQGKFGGLPALNATAATVGGNFAIQYSPHFLGKLDLTAIHTGGSILFESGQFDGPVLMSDAVIGQDLQIGQNASPTEAGESPSPQIKLHNYVEVKRARITGEARIVNASFNALDNDYPAGLDRELMNHKPTQHRMRTAIDMQAIRVGGELQLGQKTSFDGLVNLAFADVAGNLDLTEGAFLGIDLTGATIESEIRLGSPQHRAASWQPPYLLILRNVSAGALQDLPGDDSWPKALDLEGFAYRRLGGSQTASGELADRPADDFNAWLEKQVTPSPQTYIQLAQVLRTAGFSDKADAVLYAGKMREMGEATGAHWLYFVAEYAATGFGIYPLRAFWSIGALVLVGTLIFGFDGRRRWRRFDWGDWTIYSLDMLLPVVHLRQKNEEWEPYHRLARYYLYTHRLIGFLLASVIIASLTHGAIELHG
jgi:hypothetical protein